MKSSGSIVAEQTLRSRNFESLQPKRTFLVVVCGRHPTILAEHRDQKAEMKLARDSGGLAKRQTLSKRTSPRRKQIWAAIGSRSIATSASCAIACLSPEMKFEDIAS